MKMTEIKKLSPMNFSVDKLRIIKKTEKASLDLNPDIVSRPLRYYQGFPPPNQASGCITILKFNNKWKISNHKINKNSFNLFPFRN